MLTSNRRYDIDWLRVIAIGLLLIYHTAIGFQPWGIMIGFIANKNTWESVWLPMMIINIWRIPFLFFVSGMGVYFAIQNRNWQQLLRERAGRILVPFVVGIFLIVPIHQYLWQYYYQLDLDYTPNPGHLWFLGNIFIYVVIASPIFFYFRKNQDGKIVKWMKRILSNPLGVVPVMVIFIAEVYITDPKPYELYAMTWHGFFLGLLAFFFGFCFVLTGSAFWNMILRWRWFLGGGAVLLCILRLTYFQLNVPGFLLVIESDCWIFSFFGFGYKYLNHPSKALEYLSQAAYPVYILHMIFLYWGSLLLFPLEIKPPVQFILVLLFTGIGCFSVYELVIRRVNSIRPFFGLKMKSPIAQKVIPSEAS